ncbi:MULTISPECIES: helix-turn-helix transcriptional regulator [unclassified Streptomyces]|uniref:helix-turn-helix transcriptional regulator n=1 Tax=unclassified Streptomyces TaxID=2593676 RepID=UPI0006AF6848|nr:MULTISPECIES: LuxR C-terminal-related transcriptional regulator [unclassified Streptomyces]KOX36336.1 transcriptional regulator [Streptomyces sp. NRRL F-6491]KOX51478.1 transcriptional regulator [Streptomyces sp. NRRL F-6492]
MRDRYARMLDLAVEVMDADDPERVWSLLTEELLTALDATLVVGKEEPWTRERGRVELRSYGAGAEALPDESVRRRIREGYPFAGHYGGHGDRIPQSAARIAGGRVWRHSATADALRRAFGTRHTLGIPFPGAGPHVSGFMVHRPGGDFSVHDVRYATRVQPLLKAAANHRSLLNALREASGGDRSRRANQSLAAPLTPRELNVLHLLATGLPADSMARRLGISPRTVHKHLHALYRKLGAADRLDAVLRAQSAGLLAGGGEPGARPFPDR